MKTKMSLAISLLCVSALVAIASQSARASVVNTPAVQSNFLNLVVPGQTHDLDETVPVPEPIKKSPAGVTVVGQPGAGQAATFAIIPLSVDKKGRFKKHTLETAPTQKFNLGQEAILPAGKYMVSYWGSFNVVEIAAGEHKIMNLLKLNIPKVDGTYKFNAYWDLTSKEEQKKVVLYAWIQPEQSLTFSYQTTDRWGHVENSWDESVSVDELCRTSDLMPLTKKYCSAYRGDNYEALIGTAYRFQKDGNYTGLSTNWSRESGGPASVTDEQFQPASRVALGSGSDGDFVSLLAGTYILEITNLAGEKSTKMGIILK